jgi:putative phage-type endonuclease
MDRATWLAERKKGIGSSDAAAVCGVNPYETAAGVFLEKTGRLPSKDETPPMKWGTALEAVIADAYSEKTGQALVRGEPILRHERHAFMIASLDREWAGGERRIVEIKNVSIRQSANWGEPGTDEVPEWYLVQVQHQMVVAGREVADVAALIGGNDFRIYSVRYNPILADRMIEIEADFWVHVQRDECPAFDWRHPSTPDLVNAIYAPGEETIELDDDALLLAERYADLRDDISAADEERDSIKARLIAAMKTAGLATLPNGGKITRKRIARRGYSVEPTSYVDFRISSPRTKKGSIE